MANGFPTAAGEVSAADCSNGQLAIRGKGGQLPSLASLVLSVSAACQVTIEDEFGEVMFPTLYFSAAGTIVLPPFEPRSFVASSAGAGVVVKSNNSAPLSAAIEIFLIPAPEAVPPQPTIETAPPLLVEGQGYDITGEGYFSMHGSVEVLIGQVYFPATVVDANTVHFTAPSAEDAEQPLGQPFQIALRFEDRVQAGAPVGQESQYEEEDVEAVVLRLVPTLTPKVKPVPESTGLTLTPELIVLPKPREIVGLTLAPSLASIYTAPYKDTVLTLSPKGLWLLDELSGTVAFDSSGNGHDGAYVGGPTLGGAPIVSGVGASARLTPSGQYVTIPSNADFAPGTEYSFGIWVKAYSPLRGRSLLSRGVNNIGGETGFYQNGGDAQWGLVGGGAGYDVCASADNAGVDNGTRHFVVFTGKVGGTEKVYLDAVEIATLPQATAFIDPMLAIEIGRWINDFDGGSAATTIDADVSAAMWFDYQLTAGNVTTLWTAGA